MAEQRVIPLFAAAARLPRDPADHAYRTLAEVFADLIYRIDNGEDVRQELRQLAELTDNVPVPSVITEYDGIEEL